MNSILDEDLPLPEDAELRCFQPIEKAHSCYSYSKLPAEGLASDIEAQLRCQRLLELGKWIMQDVINTVIDTDLYILNVHFGCSLFLLFTDLI